MREGEPSQPVIPDQPETTEIDALLDRYSELMRLKQARPDDPAIQAQLASIESALGQKSAALPSTDRRPSDEQVLASAWRKAQEFIDHNEPAEREGVIDRLVDEIEKFQILFDETEDLWAGLPESEQRQMLEKRLDGIYDQVFNGSAQVLEMSYDELFDHWSKFGNTQTLADKLKKSSGSKQNFIAAAGLVRRGYESLIRLHQEIKQAAESR